MTTPDPKQFAISIKFLFLDIIGMMMVVFGGYELYLLSEKGEANLSAMIPGAMYPWIIILIGVICMVPFHKQVFRAKKAIKEQEKAIKERNRPDF